jgi:hypothetical protein
MMQERGRPDMMQERGRPDMMQERSRHDPGVARHDVRE